MQRYDWCGTPPTIKIRMWSSLRAVCLDSGCRYSSWRVTGIDVKAECANGSVPTGYYRRIDWLEELSQILPESSESDRSWRKNAPGM
ncbi:hypothetical protein PISMIDRAFT_11899 [Pisolithus microcarpus 441]|uniref:Uncharacterized protein n=1 Tax=Pisolithus microcarpus 441 TaxID=765257 RepID=A0A0C9ZQR5_9AGAM|nr:hypothetical protein PISMIDRAFT_11899 [Pisolithus microcarpus 441]